MNVDAVRASQFPDSLNPLEGSRSIGPYFLTNLASTDITLIYSVGSVTGRGFYPCFTHPMVGLAEAFRSPGSFCFKYLGSSIPIGS